MPEKRPPVLRIFFIALKKNRKNFSHSFVSVFIDLLLIALLLLISHQQKLNWILSGLMQSTPGVWGLLKVKLLSQHS